MSGLGARGILGVLEEGKGAEARRKSCGHWGWGGRGRGGGGGGDVLGYLAFEGYGEGLYASADAEDG